MANLDITQRGLLDSGANKANVTIPVLDENLTQDTQNLGARQKKLKLNLLAFLTDVTQAITDIKGGVATDGDTLGKLRGLISTQASVVSANTAAINAINLLLTSNDLNLDAIQEIVDYIKNNKTLIDQITTSKVSTSDVVNTLTETLAGKVLDARQGKVLKDALDTLSATVGGKASQSALDTLAGTVASNTTAIGNKANNTLSGGYAPHASDTTPDAGDSLEVAISKVDKAARDLATSKTDKTDFVALTYGASVAWNCSNGQNPLAKVTATGNFTINLSDVKSGSSGVLKVTTNTGNPIVITFDGSFTHKTLNSTFTTYTLPAGTGKEFYLSFICDGTTLEWIIDTYDRDPSKTPQVLTDGPTITWPFVNGYNASVVLTGTGRVLAITGVSAGDYGTIKIIQDSTGNRTITTWPNNSKWPSGVIPSLTSTLNYYDLFTFYYDGTYFNWSYSLRYN